MGAHMKELGEVYDVPGMLTRDEVDYLYRLAKRSRGKGVIVEIGSRKGLSTIALAHGTTAVDGAQSTP
jgi:predicted O-methyltransferase YrrM